MLYDLRNSGLYDGLIHRANLIEKVMGCIRDGTEAIVPPPILATAMSPTQNRPDGLPDETEE